MLWVCGVHPGGDFVNENARDNGAQGGMRYVGTDAITLEGVQAKQVLQTDWVLGSKNIVGVEMLTIVS